MGPEARKHLEKLLRDLIPPLDRWRHWSEETVPQERAQALDEISALLAEYEATRPGDPE